VGQVSFLLDKRRSAVVADSYQPATITMVFEIDPDTGAGLEVA
jgi:hypothetical protein